MKILIFKGVSTGIIYMWNGSTVVVLKSSLHNPFGKIAQGFPYDILSDAFNSAKPSFSIGSAYVILRRDTLKPSDDSLEYAIRFMSNMKSEEQENKKTADLLEIRENRRRMKAGECSEVMKWLLNNGFIIYSGEEDFDCIMRVHEIHHLFWSERLKHLFIAVDNKGGKKLPAGGFERWNAVIIPKPIYTVDQIQNLVNAITL